MILRIKLDGSFYVVYPDGKVIEVIRGKSQRHKAWIGTRARLELQTQTQPVDAHVAESVRELAKDWLNDQAGLSA